MYCDLWGGKVVFSEVWCHWNEWLTFGGLDFPTSEGVCACVCVFALGNVSGQGLAQGSCLNQWLVIRG